MLMYIHSTYIFIFIIVILAYKSFGRGLCFFFSQFFSTISSFYIKYSLNLLFTNLIWYLNRNYFQIKTKINKYIF
ncbi:unnamed protein product [Meloidogyne enterolobii]|uniref:Uncharacterized protein n=1 Tax=Meloidogyne enterolobii TaxID=390850 RepID=A0ACB0XVY9_MELEN